MLLIVLGGAWVPPGVGTQSWSDANAFSGTLVGEFDGWLRPALNVYGGVVGDRLGLLGSFSVASINNSQYAGTSSTHVVGALRLGVDGRAYLRPRQPGMVNVWGNLGIDAVIPRANDVSDAYTEQEQADADEASASTRAQIGGLGAHLGPGVEYLFADKAGNPAVAVGLNYRLRLFGAWEFQEEDGLRISTLWLGESALFADFFF